MSWLKLSSLVQYLMNFSGCILVFITCGSATIGLLYLQNPFEFGFQYMPAAASAAYFMSRMLFVFDKGLSVSTNEKLAYAFILSTALSVAIQIHIGLDYNDRDGKSSLDYTVAMWVFNVFYFFAGAACFRASYRKSDIIAVFLTLMVLIPFVSAPKQVLFLDYYELRQSTGLDGFTHLIIAEWCVFFFIGAFAFASNKLRPLVVIVAGVCLFGMQGRSSTVFTLFTLLAFWLLTGGKKVVFIYAGVVALLAIIFTVLPIAELLGENEAALDRMLLDADDGSLEARGDILLSSLEHLPKSILYGDPTYIAYEAGSMGSYIHNIMSMWQFFGLLPFILILVLLVRSLMVMKKRMSRGGLSVMEEIACMLLIYSAVSVIFAKSVVFYWLWFAAGYWMLQYSGSDRKVKVKKEKPPRKKKRRSMQNKSQIVPTGKFRF